MAHLLGTKNSIKYIKSGVHLNPKPSAPVSFALKRRANYLTSIDLQIIALDRVDQSKRVTIISFLNSNTYIHTRLYRQPYVLIGRIDARDEPGRLGHSDEHV